jgi:hypothetical protein
LRKYGSLEELLAAGRFAQQADELHLSHSIANTVRAVTVAVVKALNTASP